MRRDDSRPSPGQLPNYSPRGLTTDAAQLDLVSLTWQTPLGPVLVHHARHRTGAVAALLLHGAAGSWSTWTPMLATATARGQSLRDVIAIDMPGWGGSPGPGIRSTLTMDTLADAVWDVVHNGLGYDRVDITGHSLGGFIALHLAATRPESVVAVRLVSATSFAVLASIEHPLRRFRSVPAFTMLLGVFRVLRKLGSTGPRVVRVVRSLGALRPVVSPLFRHTRRVPRSVIDALADEVRPDTFVRAADETRGYPAQRLWSKIACPVWAVRGENDLFVPREDLDGLLRIVPHASLTEVPDCGHFAHIERPAETLLGLGLDTSE